MNVPGPPRPLSYDHVQKVESWIEIMMEALQSYSGEESASEDGPKEEDKKSDQEAENKSVGFNREPSLTKIVEVKGQQR